MSDEPFSFEHLFEAVERNLQGNLPGVEMVAVWPDLATGQHIPLPAVFLELAEVEPGQDIGTGETALVCKFEARIVVDVIKAHHQRQAAYLATQLAVLLRAQTWGLEVEPAEFVQAVEDWTRPELDGYTVWLVEWTQTVYLGPEEWPWPDESAGTLVFGIYPETGSGHQDDYVAPEDL